jgi:hypothetical protein
MPNKERNIIFYYTYTMINAWSTSFYVIFEGKQLMQWLKSPL